MASRSDRFIASCASWDEFYRRASALSNDEKGRHFERLVQLYLQTQPEYRTTLADVWLQRDVPADVRKTINLPQLDEGIDLIARERHGGYWAIQAKFLTANDKRLSRRLLGTFTALASDTCSNIGLQVIAHTSAKRVGKHHLYRNLREIGLDRGKMPIGRSSARPSRARSRLDRSSGSRSGISCGRSPPRKSISSAARLIAASCSCPAARARA